jgi:1-phosphofructokinase family hexose kinase
MILVAGLTPAWQQIMRFGKFQLGEVNRAAAACWCASGKVLNAGMALASLGVESHTLAPVGGWSGQAIQSEFAERHIPATWIGTPTRICTTLLLDGGPTTELVENAGAVGSIEEAFLAAYCSKVAHADCVVLTGSLPRGTPASFYRELLVATPCPAVLDARGLELLAALERKPRLVKPNREELAMTVGRPLPDRAAVLDAMRELMDRGAQSVVVTEGNAGVLFVDGDQFWELSPPTVRPIVNPIGCGDCLAAGVAWGLARGDALVDAVRLGMAAAADNITQLLPARLSMERLESLVKRIGPAVRVI